MMHQEKKILSVEKYERVWNYLCVMIILYLSINTIKINHVNDWFSISLYEMIVSWINVKKNLKCSIIMFVKKNWADY
jgi:hypothetical protein